MFSDIKSILKKSVRHGFLCISQFVVLSCLVLFCEQFLSLDFNNKHVCWWLQLRSALDPKRHYKKGDSKSKTLPKYFQASKFFDLDRLQKHKYFHEFLLEIL